MTVGTISRRTKSDLLAVRLHRDGLKVEEIETPWFDAKDLTPPLPGSWRTEGRKKDYPGLFALARWPVRRGDLIVSEVRSWPVANFELAIVNRR